MSDLTPEDVRSIAKEMVRDLEPSTHLKVIQIIENKIDPISADIAAMAQPISDLSKQIQELSDKIKDMESAVGHMPDRIADEDELEQLEKLFLDHSEKIESIKRQLYNVKVELYGQIAKPDPESEGIVGYLRESRESRKRIIATAIKTIVGTLITSAIAWVITKL